MKPTIKRWIWRVVLAFVVLLGVAGIGFIGLLYHASPEHIGLRPVGISKVPMSPGEDPFDLSVRFKAEWSRSAGNSSDEVYRFVYARSFESDICVSAWRDGKRYWIRTGVLDGLARSDRPPKYLLWERTRALSVEQWEKIRAMFAKRSVIDPLNGGKGRDWYDGSIWTLEATVHGRRTRTSILCPLQEAGTENFVETGKLMLDYGRVTVREMY